MKVKVNEKEVIWLLKGKINKGPQANKMLRDSLGADLSVKFADMQLGSYFYTWELPGDDWKKRSEAADSEIAIVDNAIELIRKAVSKRTSLADALLSVPNNDFIYYRLGSSGEVEIIYTAWGFKSFRPASGGRIVRDIDTPKEKQSTRIAFTIDGEPVPQREFHYQFAHMHKANMQLTGADGFFEFGNPLTVGDNITVVDVGTGKSFVLTVVSGQEDYTFDVTQYTSAEVVVTQDGNPLIGENVLVCYNGKEYSQQTNASGKVTVSLPYIVGREWEAKVRDSQQIHTIELKGNYAEFSFVTPVVVPPVPPAIEDIQVWVRVMENNTPVAGEQVVIVCNGQNLLFLSDATGTAATTLAYTEGMEIKVLVRNVQQQQMMNEKGNVFEYSFNAIVVPEPPARDVKLRVEDCDGMALANIPIILRQGGDSFLDCKLDENGCCFFADNLFQTGEEIEALLTNESGDEISVHFTLDEGEYDYLLVGESKKKSPWAIVLEIALLVLAVISCCLLWPYFVGTAESLGQNLFV